MSINLGMIGAKRSISFKGASSAPSDQELKRMGKGSASGSAGLSRTNSAPTAAELARKTTPKSPEKLVGDFFKGVEKSAKKASPKKIIENILNGLDKEEARTLARKTTPKSPEKLVGDFFKGVEKTAARNSPEALAKIKARKFAKKLTPKSPEKLVGKFFEGIENPPKSISKPSNERLVGEFFEGVAALEKREAKIAAKKAKAEAGRKAKAEAGKVAREAAKISPEAIAKREARKLAKEAAKNPEVIDAAATHVGQLFKGVESQVAAENMAKNINTIYGAQTGIAECTGKIPKASNGPKGMGGSSLPARKNAVKAAGETAGNVAKGKGGWIAAGVVGGLVLAGGLTAYFMNRSHKNPEQQSNPTQQA